MEISLNICPDDIENYNKYEIDNENNMTCQICLERVLKIYSTYFIKSKIKMNCCYLCNIIMNFKNIYIGKVILIYSKLSQKEINKKTHQLFNKNKYIPSLLEIDSNAKIINFPVHLFCILKNNFDENEIKIFDNYKIFFTNKIITNLKFYERNLFIKKKNTNTNINININTDIDTDVHSSLLFNIIPQYPISKKENNILNKYNNKIIKNKEFILNEIQTEFTKIVDETNNINFKIKNNIL
jgi:hypothetical protein